jgi:hypothetical protein
MSVLLTAYFQPAVKHGGGLLIDRQAAMVFYVNFTAIPM